MTRPWTDAESRPGSRALRARNRHRRGFAQLVHRPDLTERAAACSIQKDNGDVFNKLENGTWRAGRRDYGVRSICKKQSGGSPSSPWRSLKRLLPSDHYLLRGRPSRNVSHRWSGQNQDATKLNAASRTSKPIRNWCSASGPTLPRAPWARRSGSAKAFRWRAETDSRRSAIRKTECRSSYPDARPPRRGDSLRHPA
jgi:hypothetical protein